MHWTQTSDHPTIKELRAAFSEPNAWIRVRLSPQAWAAVGGWGPDDLEPEDRFELACREDLARYRSLLAQLLEPLLAPAELLTPRRRRMVEHLEADLAPLRELVGGATSADGLADVLDRMGEDELDHLDALLRQLAANAPGGDELLAAALAGERAEDELLAAALEDLESFEAELAWATESGGTYSDELRTVRAALAALALFRRRQSADRRERERLRWLRAVRAERSTFHHRRRTDDHTGGPPPPDPSTSPLAANAPPSSATRARTAAPAA